MAALVKLLAGVRSVLRSRWGLVGSTALLLLVGLGVWLLWPRDTTLQQVQARGVWRVGLDPSFPPFESLEPASGKPVGLDVDLAQAIAARWGVKAEIVPIGFDEVVDAVAAHKVDSAISALPVFPWRTRELAFSTPYVEAGVVLATPPGSPITGTLGLGGRRVAVEWGSEGDAQARALQRGPVSNMQLVQREAPDQALSAVAGGQADAAIVDAISLALFNRSGGNLVVVGPPLRSDPYVVVLPRNAPGLLTAVNSALADLQADGTLAQLQKKWLGKN